MSEKCTKMYKEATLWFLEDVLALSQGCWTNANLEIHPYKPTFQSHFNAAMSWQKNHVYILTWESNGITIL